jgi:hypothetical protein
MALNLDNLCKVGGGQGGAPAVWTYVTTDALTDVDGANYFNGASALLKVNDWILLARTGTPAWGIAVVNANSAGAVDITNATAIGAVDSD